VEKVWLAYYNEPGSPTHRDLRHAGTARLEVEFSSFTTAEFYPMYPHVSQEAGGPMPSAYTRCG
jgi:hypothetical protein